MQKMSIKEFTNNFVETSLNKRRFQVRQIANQYNYYCISNGFGIKKPYSDTVGRYLRERRAKVGDVHYFDYGKSIWWKSDHDATAEERRAYGC